MNFYGNALAAAQASNGSGGIWMIVIYLVVIVALFYFMIIRPNKKRQKQEQELRNSIALGAEITTIGGIVGTVVNIKDDNITIETSIDKTLIEFKNWAVRDVKKLESEEKADK